MKKKKITKREIQQELYACRFDPNTVPMNVIIDTDNVMYWKLRAVELLKTEKTTESLVLAVQLLIIALIKERQQLKEEIEAEIDLTSVD